MVPNPTSLTIGVRETIATERTGKNGHLNQSLLLLNGIPLPFHFLLDLIDFRQLPCRLERDSLNSLLFLKYTGPSVHEKLVPGPPSDTKIRECSTLL